MKLSASEQKEQVLQNKLENNMKQKCPIRTKLEQNNVLFKHNKLKNKLKKKGLIQNKLEKTIRPTQTK